MLISKESFDEKYRKRLEKLETTNIADALDSLGYHFFPWGVEPMTTPQKNIVGRAVTVQITAAGTTKSKGHMCVNAIEAAEAGDVIVIANGGKVDVNCWGGLLATASKMKGLAGTVIDGACRDIQDYDELDYQVYARGRVVATARGHLIEQSTNEMIRFGDVQVHPGDIVCADKSGVVFIPQVMLDDTIVKAEELQKKEDDMCAELKAGRSMGDLDKKYDYEHMGSAPNAAASADTSHPAKQGAVQSISVYIDTLIICSTTAFIDLLSNQLGAVDDKGQLLNGIPFVQQALKSQMGSIGIFFVTISILLFAFSSIIGNFYYAEANMKFITPSKNAMVVFKIICTVVVFVGAMVSMEVAWSVADIIMAAMATINLIAIFLLRDKAFAAYHDYMNKKKAGKPLNFMGSDIGLDDLDCWHEEDLKLDA